MRPEVVTQISKAISTYLEINDTADTLLPVLWDALKMEIRGEFIGVSAADNKLRREKRAHLQHQVTELEKIHKMMGAQGSGDSSVQLGYS
ncbi:hypothetical protein NDU88_002046 [Pleurodeles waltl]|uniref:GED domain-containing protein n=1 Tax=Pleurodeles waltl TaxID=8319 RepID=A0AAV7SAH9_PLEWA|nr:hypothetical protein NDU88_002046 [Pleurodeles waltl]